MSFRQLILRLPDELKREMRDCIKKENMSQVEVRPEGRDAHGTGRFRFMLNGRTYPARLVNLPCVVESLKTIDKEEYFKSGDIGQMLIVYMDQAACDADARKVKPQGYYPDGLTPPTKNIVQRKFNRARKPQGTVPNKVVFAVEGQLMKMQSMSASDPVKEVYEETVAFEPWMLDPVAAQSGKMAGISVDFRNGEALEALNATGTGGSSGGGGSGSGRGGDGKLFGQDLLLRHPEILLANFERPPAHVAEADAPKAHPASTMVTMASRREGGGASSAGSARQSEPIQPQPQPYQHQHHHHHHHHLQHEQQQPSVGEVGGHNTAAAAALPSSHLHAPHAAAAAAGPQSYSHSNNNNPLDPHNAAHHQPHHLHLHAGHGSAPGGPGPGSPHADEEMPIMEDAEDEFMRSGGLDMDFNEDEEYIL